METLDYEIRVPKISDWVKLWFFSDPHEGTVGCATGHMRGTVKAIADDPNAYAVHLGDAGDFINYTDPRFEISEVVPELRGHLDDLPRQQVKMHLRTCEPMRGKMICFIPGNHDEKIRSRYHYHVADAFSEGMGIPLLAAQSILRIRVRDKSNHRYVVKGLLSHAEKAAVTLGGKINATERVANNFDDLDFIAQAHMHGYGHWEIPKIGVAGKFEHGKHPRIVEKALHLFLTGSYLRTYHRGQAGYGERRAYPPSKLGSPRIEMRMARKAETDEVELRGV